MDNESNLIFDQYLNEAKEAPKGKHFDSAGRIRKGDADSDGRGGPKYRSDPTYVNPNDEEIPEEDDLGLGHNQPSTVHITVGEIKPFKRKTEQPSEDETVYIQAGEKEHHGEEKHEFSYDGEIDMARAELLKANDYTGQLFDMVANAEALPGWVSSKITKASDYLSSVFHYLDYEMKFKGEECQEDSVNDSLKDQYTQEAAAKGLRGAELESYVEDKMTQPGPHG